MGGKADPIDNYRTRAGKVSDTAALWRLAALSPLDYDRVRKAEAETLGVRPAVLDQEVAKVRGAGNPADEAQGRAIELYQPEPWPKRVHGAECLSEALTAIQRHMAIREEHAIAAVLWAAHVHVYDVFSHTPRLAITAPDAECGKTLLLQLVGALVPRPQPVEMMKPAPFFRMVERHRPCFLIDETDVFIKDDSELLAALNNGWEPHGGVVRCVGDDFEVRSFSTHTPVAMGGIKLHKVLPATTLSRSIVVTLERAMPGEIAEPYDLRKHRAGLLEIGRKLTRWCQDQRDALRRSEPTLPGGALNRRADKWRPLFAIAQRAGGDWPALAERAYLAEEREGSAKLAAAVQLLADIREVMRPEEHVIGTDELINRLCALDESPWEEYNFRERDSDRRRLQPRQVSGLLKDYRVRPMTVRAGAWTGKGYRRPELEIAWNRYLPPTLSVTPSQATDGAASSDSVSVTS